MKKIFCLLVLIFTFVSSIAYGEIDWRELKNKSVIEVTIEAISSCDPVFAKVLNNQELRDELKEKVEKKDGEDEDIAAFMLLDAVFGVMLNNDSNFYDSILKDASSFKEYDNLIYPMPRWADECSNAVDLLGEEFASLLKIMRNRFGSSFFSPSYIEILLFSGSGSDSKDDLPGIDDFTEIVFKAYRKGIITYSELESVWEKIKRGKACLMPNILYLYLAPVEKFHPGGSKRLFPQKLEDYISRNDEL